MAAGTGPHKAHLAPGQPAGAHVRLRVQPRHRFQWFWGALVSALCSRSRFRWLKPWHFLLGFRSALRFPATCHFPFTLPFCLCVARLPKIPGYGPWKRPCVPCKGCACMHPRPLRVAAIGRGCTYESSGGGTGMLFVANRKRLEVERCYFYGHARVDRGREERSPTVAVDHIPLLGELVMLRRMECQVAPP